MGIRRSVWAKGWRDTLSRSSSSPNSLWISESRVRVSGKGLLKDALQRTAQAAEIAGIRAMLVHAKDKEASAFYQRFDFEPSPTDSRHLFLLVKDIRRFVSP
jgi:hypothetical protein